METLKLSAKTGEGMSDSLQFLERRNPHFQAAAAATQQSY
jgi:hypothetical protein